MWSLFASVCNDGGHDRDDRFVRLFEDERPHGEPTRRRHGVEPGDFLQNEADYS
jgi:hypothetical protein